MIPLLVGSWSNIKSRFVNIKTITIHKKRAIHSISLNFLPISINFLAPYNCAIIGVTEKMTPEIKNQIALPNAVPNAKPARSFALALPATITSVAPISIYDI